MAGLCQLTPRFYQCLVHMEIMCVSFFFFLLLNTDGSCYVHCFESVFFPVFKQHYLEKFPLEDYLYSTKALILERFEGSLQISPGCEGSGCRQSIWCPRGVRPPGHCPNPPSSANLLFHWSVALNNLLETVLQKLSWTELCCAGKSRDCGLGTMF